MIAPGDRVRLAPGVALRDGALEDAVRGAAWPLNGAADLVLAQAGAGTLAETAAALAEQSGVAPEVALADVEAFCADLNAKLLLNVEPAGGRFALAVRWLSAALGLLPLRAFPRLPLTRHALDTRTATRAVLSVTRALALPAFSVAALFAGVGALLLAGAGAHGLRVAFLVGISAAAGLVVHEAGHAAALRGVPACLGRRGLRAFVLHLPVPPLRRAVVAAVGPVAAAFVGWLVLLAAHALALADLALAASLLTTQALGLTVVARDGRTLCGLS